MEIEPQINSTTVQSRFENATHKAFVSNEDESLRLFENNFLEKLTKVHPVIPLVIFVPVVTIMLWKSAVTLNQSVDTMAFTFFAGLLFWTLFEYSLHRFVFHFEPKKDGLFMRVHFLFHGIHHAYPRDSRRLVMPPSVSIPLAFLVYLVWMVFVPSSLVPSSFAGFIFGYLCYDMVHYGIHHLNFTNSVWQKIKRHHYRHHYSDKDRGFGVSSPLWDYIFKSDF